MPRYDFKCHACEKVYEELTQYDETDVYADIVCPHCGHDKKTKLMSCIAPIPNKDTHDYRFWSKIEKDRGIRQAAEAAQGPASYNPIDDISSGNYFGEVE